MSENNPWLNTRREGGKNYDARWEEMAKAGQDVHGEANFVMRYEPETVLDAGCGTGRVAIELARRGCKVVGVDLDPKMLERAQEKMPDLAWRLGDLATVQLDQKFALIVMAGNVMLFVTPGTEAQVITNIAGHLAAGGKLISGFQLNRKFSLMDYDQFCEAAGLTLLERFATWDGDAWQPSTDYAVSVHSKKNSI